MVHWCVAGVHVRVLCGVRGRWHRRRREQDLRRPDDRHLAKNRQSASPEPHAVPRVRHVRVSGYRQMCLAVLSMSARSRARRADGEWGWGWGLVDWWDQQKTLYETIFFCFC